MRERAGISVRGISHCLCLVVDGAEDTQKPTFPRRGPQPFRHRGLVSWKTIFYGDGWGWYWGDSIAWHWSCTLFLLFLHQPHLRSSGTRPQSLGAPAVWGSQWRLGGCCIRDVNVIMTAPESALSLLALCWGLGEWGCFICFLVFNVWLRSGLPSWSVTVPSLLRITEGDNGK